MIVDALTRAGGNLTREGLMSAAGSMTEAANPFLLPGVEVRTTTTDHFPITQMEIGHFHRGIFQLSGTSRTPATQCCHWSRTDLA
jgi:hypothetical protein